jgi:hypothetical protein
MSEWYKLTISAVGLETHVWLQEWRWLVPTTFSPLWLNAFGDWVFTSRDGSIHFLDLIEGTFTPVAPSMNALSELLKSIENRNRWLMADWVGICKERGLHLNQGQCYGWKLHPILGGKFEFENIQAFDLGVYESITGQIHRQVKHLPPGYTVTELKIGPR